MVYKKWKYVSFRASQHLEALIRLQILLKENCSGKWRLGDKKGEQGSRKKVD